MRNIFKIKIPKDNAQEITVLESWTVSWTVAQSIRWGEAKEFNKCFIKEVDAIEFDKQLKESAKFIDTPIITNYYKNK